MPSAVSNDLALITHGRELGRELLSDVAVGGLRAVDIARLRPPSPERPREPLTAHSHAFTLSRSHFLSASIERSISKYP